MQWEKERETTKRQLLTSHSTPSSGEITHMQIKDNVLNLRRCFFLFPAQKRRKYKNSSMGVVVNIYLRFEESILKIVRCWVDTRLFEIAHICSDQASNSTFWKKLKVKIETQGANLLDRSKNLKFYHQFIRFCCLDICFMDVFRKTQRIVYTKV